MLQNMEIIDVMMS